MTRIQVQGTSLDLPEDFLIGIEDNSPIYNERGSQSIPVMVPATDKNCKVMGFPNRLDSAYEQNNPNKKASLIDGAYIRSGLMNVTGASSRDGITFNIGFDNSTAYATWKEKRLCDLDNLPEYKVEDIQGETEITHLLDYLYNIYQAADPQKHDFAVFPIAISKEEVDGTIYWEMLNQLHNSPSLHCPLEQPRNIKRVVDGVLTDITVPEGYGVSPFLRVWRVVELVFDNLGLKLLRNPFKEDLDLARLVVLNNSADTLCVSKIKYCDLMPDSTVSQFMNALWVRFGLVYDIDYDAATVDLRLIRDIVDKPGMEVWDSYMTDIEQITYNMPQYLKLSAKTSLDGAEPATPRFEDFIRGLDVRDVHLGTHVSQWINLSPRQDHDWDGDVNDDFYDYEEPDDPDIMDDIFDHFPGVVPDDDYWDDWWDDYDDLYDYYSAGSQIVPLAVGDVAGESRQTTRTNSPDTFLAREFVTGMWHKLDKFNGSVMQSSSCFFSWDPASEGLDALELESDDECVPVVSIGNGYYPAYLCGARHYHSFIKGDGNADETCVTSEETPLAFMLAFDRQGTTIGRLSPEGEDGKPFVCDSGTPTLSLLFQFKDGLFAKFWARYDEILRHANRTVEVSMARNKAEIRHINWLVPVLFKNVRCMPDTISYSFPSVWGFVPFTAKLRTLTTQGSYDIKKEQNVPDFAVAQRHLEFRLAATNFKEIENDFGHKERAVSLFIRQTGYQSSGTQDDNRYVGVGGLEFVKKVTVGTTWRTDSRLVPYSIKDRRTMSYNANITYDVYELHEVDGVIEREETPLGQVVVPATYNVTVQAVWVMDVL